MSWLLKRHSSSGASPTNLVLRPRRSPDDGELEAGLCHSPTSFSSTNYSRSPSRRTSGSGNAAATDRPGFAVKQGSMGKQRPWSAPRKWSRVCGTLLMALLRWLLLALAGCLTALVVLWAFRGAQAGLRQWGVRTGEGARGMFDVSQKQLLSFSVCESMADQRLALVSGVVLAFELGRVVMLPDLMLDGAEGPDRGRTLPFSSFYDVNRFISAMAEVGMEAVDPHRAWPKELYTPSYFPEVEDPVEELAAKHRSTKHLHVECPLHRLPRAYFTGANSRIMWAVLEALEPSKELAKHVNTMRKQLARSTHHGTYNFLHVPLDTEWLRACAAAHNTTVASKNNCKTNVDSIDLMLLNLDMPVTEPLYVSSEWARASPDVAELVLKKLQVFKVLTSKEFPTQLTQEPEIKALIEYHVALGANKLVGNALHAFSEVAIVHRRHRNQWSSYYNGGHMPLIDYMPLDQLPWVFTYSPNTPELDYLIRATVRSGLQHRALKPFCIFRGDQSAPIAQWLAAQGVTLLSHTFSWADELWAMAEPLAAQNQRISPIFSSKDALVDNYMRLELPKIEALSQHVYVLFTEQDVFFHKRVSLSLFSRPELPEVVGMTPDLDVPQGVDGAFMIANLPALRDSYLELKAFVLSSKDGGLFAAQGLGAAGALHAFAHGPSSRAILPPHFAAKPFQDLDPIAFVVHFKGPKPHNYLDFFRTDRCEPEAYGAACEQGLTRSLCPYLKKWHMLLDESEDEVGLSLWYACLALYAPHLRGLSRHRLAHH